MRILSAVVFPVLLSTFVVPFDVLAGDGFKSKTRFNEVTGQVGLAGKKGALPSWCDFDMDGRPDLFAGGRLYRNQGPPAFRFAEITEEAFGVKSPGGRGVFGDVDNNGYPDLVVPGPDKADPLVAGQVWLNDGKGKFKPLPVKGNKAEPDFNFIATAGFGDFDLDGFVDLFLVCNEDWNKGKPRYFRGFLFRNEKGKGFRDVTWEANLVGAPARYGRGVAFGDYNNDGFPDIHISNYRIEDNFLWENMGDGTFENVAAKKGVMGVARRHEGGRKWYGHSIGAAWGDLNNDGNLDLWVSNLVHKDGKYGYHRGYICDDSKVYLNQGAPDFRFLDIRKSAGIPVVPMDKIGVKPDGSKTIVDELWAGAALGDFDNNGTLDAFVPQVYDLHWAFAHLYRNEGGTRFLEIHKESGIQVFDTYSGAWADYDSDGFLDLATFGRPNVGEKKRIMLYRNGGTGGKSLRIRLCARESNGSAIGARLTLRFEEGLMIREVEGGTSSHGQQNSPTVHFGLGNRKPESLDIRWPTGRIQRIKSPKPGQAFEVKEARSPLPRILSIRIKPDQPSTGEEVEFKVKIRSPRNTRIRSYNWDFDGDNLFETSSSRGRTVHIFDKPGVHLVRVRAWFGKGGCAVEKTRRVTVRE